MGEHVVGTVEEIPPGGRKIVEVGGRSIGVFNVGGEFFALRNQCPHQGAELCKGVLSGFVHAEKPGDVTYVRRGEILRCPWHQWEFDIRTGQSWVDPAKVRVRRYEAKVAPGNTLLSEPGGSKELAEAGLEKGLYVAETYEVSVEHEYIVLNL
ncbi:Rieske 2Fe-2S domain-containing protein [Rubrobacter tropicus]|uniref:Rieske 2Fe-2S domain-containing protein n=1 Tax=Rubrobacter tropicus TaxID=2653851 RepID=A0A6G8Q4Q0_9ACTN|nr:Rieske (2Fe-2S) protein [Rubrobacter tropicus]QIN81474.1 Rieske 2Fe-2S domain-containing protein [Rubrobacter tropicus]